jgi:hypothetical protein
VIISNQGNILKKKEEFIVDPATNRVRAIRVETEILKKIFRQVG